MMLRAAMKTSADLTPAQRDMLFRISEIRQWVSDFIAQGNSSEAGNWANTSAHIGNRLLALEINQHAHD